MDIVIEKSAREYIAAKARDNSIALSIVERPGGV